MFWAWAEKRFVFEPKAEVSATPADVGLQYEDVRFNTADGMELHGWFLPSAGGSNGSSANGACNQTWLWFHGNGGNLGTRVEQLLQARQLLGVHQFIFDYRGYGNSSGRPTERGTYLDARAALQHLKNRSDIDPGRIVYFGHSLGTGVAIELASEHPPAGMALISPFASMRDMAGLVVRLPMAGWFVRGHFNSVHRIGKVHTPLLVLHGNKDEIVPYEQGVKLYHAANRPKRFVSLNGAAHDDMEQVAADTMGKALVDFRNGIEFGDVAPGYTPLTISL